MTENIQKSKNAGHQSQGCPEQLSTTDNVQFKINRLSSALSSMSDYQLDEAGLSRKDIKHHAETLIKVLSEELDVSLGWT